MRFRMFMLVVSGAAALAAGVPPVAAQTQDEEITSTVIPLGPARAPAAKIDRVCKFVAKDPSIKKTGEWSQSGSIDVNNDGIKEDVTLRYEGTMRIESFDIKSPDGKPVSIEPYGFERRDFWSFGSWWLSYEGYTYNVNYKDNDGKFPSYLTYVDASNTEWLACTFKQVTTLQIRATDPRYKAVCQKAQNRKSEFKSAHSAPPKTVRDPDSTDIHDPGGYVNSAGPVTAVDFDNDGKKEYLIRMGGYITGGRGDCSRMGYDLVDENRRILKDSPKRALLEDLHIDSLGFDVSGYGECGYAKRFVVIDDKVYLEIKSDTLGDEYYALTLAENGDTTFACVSTRSTRTILNPLPANPFTPNQH